MTPKTIQSNATTMPLLATRFFIPPLAVNYISRPRLFNLLESGLQFPVILISAAAGFGKTSLVSEWVNHRPDLAAAWLSLEQADNDWVRFFRYLVTAWQKVFPQVGRAALVELQDSHYMNIETRIDSLLNDMVAQLASFEAPHAILVLDDYHQIRSRVIHQAMNHLIDHLPSGVHLAVLTRLDPPLPLARWRSRQRLLEIRAADLRFTLAETTGFLNHTMRLNLTSEQIEILETRTEGWSVGLQLAAHALQAHIAEGRESVHDFVQDFKGSHRFVLDYLMEEVLNQQSEEIKRFLLLTAPLEQLCGPLCDGLLETSLPYAQHMLERLEKANLFLIPLDEYRQWFRYHHLFADLLRARLKQIDPDQFTALYLRASAWFARESMWHEAIYYANLAQDYDLGAVLFEHAIRRDGLDFIFSGVQAMIEPFPKDWIENRPYLSMVEAMRMIETSQLDGIESLLRFAESGILGIPPFEGQSNVLGMIYVIQSIAASLLGNSDWIQDASRQAAKLLQHNYKANVNALIQLGVASLYQGKLNDTDTCWEKSLDISLANGYTFGILCNLDNLGRLYCYQGELLRAESIFIRLLEQLSDEPARFPRWQGAAYRDYSDLLREWNRLDEARVMMNEGIDLCEKWETASGRGLGYIHLGRILMAQGDAAGAFDLLDKAERLSSSHTVYPDLEALIQVYKSGLLLEQGEFDAAWNVLEACIALPCCQHVLQREWVQIAQARTLLRMDRPTEGLTLLESALNSAMDHGRGKNWLEMTLLCAVAYHKISRNEQSLRFLHKGVEFGQAQGFIRVFLDEGKPMRELLETLCAHSLGTPLKKYLSTLNLAFKDQAVEIKKDMDQLVELVEPLSNRELEVLQ